MITKLLLTSGLVAILSIIFIKFYLDVFQESIALKFSKSFDLDHLIQSLLAITFIISFFGTFIIAIIGIWWS